MFPTTLDDLPNKWYKIEEARGDTFTWETLRENFIKDFSFTHDDEKLKPIAKQIQQFIGVKSSNEMVENNPTKECRHTSTDEIQHSTILQLETDHFPRKSFQLKKNHPLGNIKVKTLYKIETEEKPTKENIEEEKPGDQDFPPQYSKIKEGKRDLDETKASEWMDAEIKIKEINIAKEGDPKMARIGDYWSEQ